MEYQRNPPKGVSSREKLTCAETRSEPVTFFLLGGEDPKQASAHTNTHVFLSLLKC